MRIKQRIIIPVMLAVSVFSVFAEAKSRTIINADPENCTDDVLALALAFSSPELDVGGVIVSGTSLSDRAQVVCNIEYLSGRSDIGVYVVDSGGPVSRISEGLHKFSEGFGHICAQEKNGLDFLHEFLAESSEPVTIISIAPLTTIAKLYGLHPGDAEKIGRILWSQGSVTGWDYYKKDPAAAELVMASSESVLVLEPQGAQFAVWDSASRSYVESTGLPLGEGLREIGAMCSPSAAFPVPNTLLTAFAADPSLAVESASTSYPSDRPGAFRDRKNVKYIQGVSSSQPAEFIKSRLSDRRLAVYHHLKAALSYFKDLSPALGDSLEKESTKLQKALQDIESGKFKMKDSERYELLQNIHRVLKRVEIAKSHESARRMILALSTAGSILADVRVVFDPRYYKNACFPGIVGDKAYVTLGLVNNGPFDVGRAKLSVTDWTKKSRKSESLIRVDPKGGGKMVDLTFPVPLADEFEEFRRIYIIAEYQIESGWTTLLKNAWVRVVPPFTMSLGGPVNERSVLISVNPNTVEPEIGLRAAPTYGGWSVVEPNRTLAARRPTTIEIGPIVQSLPDYFSAHAPFNVEFVIPKLGRDDFNRLTVAGRSGTYQDELNIVFPLPGANVTWLPSSLGRPVSVVQIDGRWALSTGLENGNPYIAFNVLDSYLFQGKKDVLVEVDYYDEGRQSDSFSIKYDSTYTGDKGILLETPRIVKSGTIGWHRCYFHLEKAYFGNRQPDGADFRIDDCADGRELIGPVRATVDTE